MTYIIIICWVELFIIIRNSGSCVRATSILLIINSQIPKSAVYFKIPKFTLINEFKDANDNIIKLDCPDTFTDVAILHYHCIINMQITL